MGREQSNDRPRVWAIGEYVQAPSRVSAVRDSRRVASAWLSASEAADSPGMTAHGPPAAIPALRQGPKNWVWGERGKLSLAATTSKGRVLHPSAETLRIQFVHSRDHLASAHIQG